MVRQTHFSSPRKSTFWSWLALNALHNTKLRHYSINQDANGIYLSLFNRQMCENDAKIDNRIAWSIIEILCVKHGQLKQFVYALFTQRQEKRSCENRNSLILKVDQPGLEPGTSRLWVCCSNQLSYKSDVSFVGCGDKSSIFPRIMQILLI